ncbi:dTDP-glucose 4,6-dehydratase [bacterium]|nr:MAG: dTDP-glucose 4,6-dehydratase [bacterium]
MRKKLPKILITGGAGFIGSEFVRQAIGKGYLVIVVDKLTYAGDLSRLKDVKGKFKFYRADICDQAKIEQVFKKEKPGILINFAAETHVDRSINACASFIETNVKGTRLLLDLARIYRIKKFVHISTDEVYGEIRRGSFSESSSLNPGNPYAASKACADLLIKSYIRTYDFPAVIVRPCNNYGPAQYPEKFIPVVISKAIKNQAVPVYAKGTNVRDWLYVSDCAEAILLIMERARPGEIYNVAGAEYKRNITVAKEILVILDKPQSLIRFIKDRPGHDFRYSMSTKKIKKELGWQAKTRFGEGLLKTVYWYLNNQRAGRGSPNCCTAQLKARSSIF